MLVTEVKNASARGVGKGGGGRRGEGETETLVHPETWWIHRGRRGGGGGGGGGSSLVGARAGGGDLFDLLAVLLQALVAAVGLQHGHASEDRLAAEGRLLQAHLALALGGQQGLGVVALGELDDVEVVGAEAALPEGGGHVAVDGGGALLVLVVGRVPGGVLAGGDGDGLVSLQLLQEVGVAQLPREEGGG